MAISRSQYVENLHLEYYGPRETDVNSLYLNYDLKTNYLHHEEIEVKSLQELCILTAVVKAFECDQAVEEMRQISNDEDADNLFAVVENKLSIKKLPPKFVKEIKLEIRLVFKEIYRFLMSISREDKFAFLGNFVFNWQGAIHPRKTVLKVLNCSTLSVERKFEFSCKYLFDEEIIRMYFNDLGETQSYYTNPNNFVGIFGYLNYYWVSRIQGQLQRPPAYLSQIGKHELISSTFFIQYIKSPYCSEIGVQFLFENLALTESVVRQVIENLFQMNSLKYHMINVSMYLCKLQNYGMFRKYSDEILIKLIKNPRWHNIFIKYFIILRFLVREDLILFEIIIKELMFIIKLEGKGGKYYSILKDFIKLIPSRSKTKMRKYVEYASLVFSLFVYKDIETIKPLFYYHPISNLNVCDAFYEFVSKYSDMSSLFCDYSPSVVEEFIRETLESEDKISELLTKLKIE